MAEATVLVIDDDRAIVALLTDALQDAGYRVLSALNEAALRLAHDAHPQVILLDLDMPGLDGAAISRRLRADAATMRIPLVLMSARHNLLARAALLPVDDHLAKPFDLDTVEAIVARWSAAPLGRLRWRLGGGREFAFDRAPRRVVAWCLHDGHGGWWVLLRTPPERHGPYASQAQAKAAAEARLLA